MTLVTQCKFVQENYSWLACDVTKNNDASKLWFLYALEFCCISIFKKYGLKTAFCLKGFSLKETPTSPPHIFLFKELSCLLTHIYVVKCIHAQKCCSISMYFFLFQQARNNIFAFDEGERILIRSLASPTCLRCHLISDFGNLSVDIISLCVRSCDIERD